MIEAGTIIHGTLRTQDLIPAFLDVLAEVAPVAHAQYMLLPFGPIPAHAMEDDSATWWASEEAAWILEDISEALNDAASEHGLYFGTLEGDGSDFGFWEVSE